MELSILLKANIKYKKGSFISVMILTLIIVTTAAAVLGVRKNYQSALKTAQDGAEVGSANIYISDRSLDEDLLDKVRRSSLVDKAEVYDSFVNTGKTVFPRYSDENSYFFFVMRDGLKLYSPGHDSFEDTIPELNKGEIYLPYGLRSKMDCTEGDIIKSEFSGTVREFRIKGFLQEPVHGSSMIGWKNVFISRSDYDEIYRIVEAAESETNTKLFKEVRVFKADSGLSDAKFLRQLNLETGIVSKSTGSLTNEQSEKYTGLFMNIILDVVLGFVAVLFVIVLIIIAHSIRTEIEMDYENLGILKAQGFTNRKITQVILLRYVLAEIIGMAAGIILSVPLERSLSGIFMKTTGILPDRSIAFGGTALIVLGIFLLSAGLVFFSARRLARISPVRAISGGREDIYFSSRLTAPITKRGLTASIAYRSFTSSLGKYIGILFITALLTFFTVTVNVMSSAINSRSALESMGIYYDDISLRAKDSQELLSRIDEIERTVEKYTPIEKKYYGSAVYLSVDGENIMCEVWKDVHFLPGLLKGRLPLYNNEILVTISAADALDLEIGSRVTVSRKTQEESYIVSGIYQTGNDAGYCTAMSLDAAKRIGINSLSSFGLVLADTSEADQIAKELNSRYGELLTATAQRFEDDLYNDTLMSAARAMRIMIYAFSGVFALVAVIMVCTKAFMQERTDLGIYKSIGFTERKLRKQFAVRFLIISLAGSIVGAAAGALFSDDLLNLIFSLFGVNRVTTDSTPLTFIGAGAFITASVTLFALLTSRRIKKVSIRELITE